MPRYCSINPCKYFTGAKTSDNVTIYQTPIDPGMREKWINEIKKHQKINQNFRICQLHFEDKYFLYEKKKNGQTRARLKPDAIPTIFVSKSSDERTHTDISADIAMNSSQQTYEDMKYPIILNRNPQIRSYSRENVDSSGPQRIEPRKLQRVKLIKIVKTQPQPQTPSQTQSQSKLCIQCIQLDIKKQTQQRKITRLEETSIKLKTELKNLKRRLERLSRQNKLQPKAAALKDSQNHKNKSSIMKCGLCHEKMMEKDIRSHICNGDKDISCDYCERSFTSILDLVKHLDDDHTEKTFYECNKCPRVFSMSILLQFHAKRHPIDEILYFCKICNEKCYTKYQLKKHIDELHLEQPKSEELKPFECGICGKCFATAQGLRIHMTNIHDKLSSKSFECFLCKSKLKSLHETRFHLRTHERKEKCVVCNEKCTALELDSHMCIGFAKSMNCVYCPQTCNTMKDLLQHLEVCKSEKLIYGCDFCPTFFMMERLKDIHMKHHEDPIEKRYSCDICSKSFANQSTLLTHKRRHELTRDHLCEECGKSCISARNLELHKMIHREKSIKCPHCDAKFTTSMRLKNHMERHQNVKFVCNICGALLATSRGLRKHKKIHTRNEADRKFACTLCPQKFFTSDRLRSHIRLKHNAGERFECEFCGDTYKYNGDLTKHKRLMHLGDDLYECPTCPKRFRLPYELERHKFEHYVPSESGQQK